MTDWKGVGSKREAVLAACRLAVEEGRIGQYSFGTTPDEGDSCAKCVLGHALLEAAGQEEFNRICAAEDGGAWILVQRILGIRPSDGITIAIASDGSRFERALELLDQHLPEHLPQ